MANDMSFSSGIFDGLSLEQLLGDVGREIVEQREGKPQEPTIKRLVIGSGGRCFEIINGGKKDTND